jgi:hypothetical protein
VVSYGKASCNVSGAVPNITQNRFIVLEQLLTIRSAQLIATGSWVSIAYHTVYGGIVKSYRMHLNSQNMMSIAHGGYGAWVHGTMANKWELEMAQSGYPHRDTMKYNRSTQPVAEFMFPVGWAN